MKKILLMILLLIVSGYSFAEKVERFGCLRILNRTGSDIKIIAVHIYVWGGMG